MKNINIGIIIMSCCTIAYSQFIVPPITNPHPRLLMKQADIDIMKTRISTQAQPWYFAWNDLQTSANNSLNFTPSPYTGRDSLAFYDSCRIQGGYARNLAITYLVTSNNIYAQKAIDYIIAWSTADPLPASDFDPNIRYPNSGMEVTRSTIQIIWAYDLLYNHPLMTENVKTDFENWLRVLESVIREGITRWQISDYFGQQYYQNHIAAHTMGLIMLGYVLGDREMVQYAVDSEEYPRDLAELIGGCIFMEGDGQHYYDSSVWPVNNGEIYDRYRHLQVDPAIGIPYGLAYSMLTLNLLTLSAEMTYINGLDFYNYVAPGGENILLAYEFYSEFYTTAESCIGDGFYCGEINNRMTEGHFEIANKRYPDNPAITRYLKSISRPKLHTSFTGFPALTHGEDIGPRENTVIARWDMNAIEQTTYLSQQRGFIPDSSEYKHKLVLGYQTAGTGIYAPLITPDGQGASGEIGDRALFFNGVNSGAFSQAIWPDADKVAIEFYVKPASFQSAQTIIYATNSFEVRLSPVSASTAKLDLNVWHQAGVQIISSPACLILNEWNHVKAFAGNGKAFIILNEQQSPMTDIPGIAASYDGGIYFGATHTFSLRFFSGMIDDLQISYFNEICSLTGYMQGDLDKDCYVNISDLSLMAQQWLICTNPNKKECINWLIQ